MELFFFVGVTVMETRRPEWKWDLEGLDLNGCVGSLRLRRMNELSV